ncbi:MAG: APC family permease, partial [Acidobacteria bacterium]|nr:APC family permease [Acidobacteriota bacterium]
MPLKSDKPGLVREMGLLGLAATGICSMLGAGINVVPFRIQRSVPGIGPHVVGAFAVAAIPALLAALAYAVLASAMPRAGGSYVFASRTLSPYWGFVASFSQWFGLSIVIGVVSYLVIPFLRDIAQALSWDAVAVGLEGGVVRVSLALALVWLFVYVNIRGARFYERTLIPLMWVMFALGGIVIVAGFSYDHADFAQAVAGHSGEAIQFVQAPELGWRSQVAAVAILFASFIGFDSIAQAGGEARNPQRNLPLAIGISILSVGAFYLLFTAAVYHAVPWWYIAAKAVDSDLTAPGLLGQLLAPGWTVAIVAGAAVALINDIPAMLLSVSRLVFAWAQDGVFPARLARVHSRWHTPHLAIFASGLMASLGIFGSHLAGDFFLGIDILVTSMLVNFLLMCLAVLRLPRAQPELDAGRRLPLGSRSRWWCALAGAILLGFLLAVHIGKDLGADGPIWYLRSTPVWLAVMALG